MVLVMVGVLAVFALPRMLDLTAWRLRAYTDELRALTLEQQRLALLQRRPVTLSLAEGGATFTAADGSVLAQLPCPVGATPCLSGAVAQSATFNAAHSGRTTTSTGAALVLTIASQGWRLETETGLFRPAP